MRSLVLLLVGLLSFAVLAQAQVSGEGTVDLKYHFRPGASYMYRLISTRDAIDPDRIAKYTSEFTDTAILRITVDSVLNGAAIVTGQQVSSAHHDRSKSTDGQGTHMGHDPLVERVRFLVRPNGQLDDSSIVELGNSAKESRSGYREDLIRMFNSRDLRRMHRYIFPALIQGGDFRKLSWDDTEKVIVNTFTIGGEESPNNITGHRQQGRVDVKHFTVTPSINTDGSNAIVLAIAENSRIGKDRPSVTDTKYTYRKADGILLDYEESDRQPSDRPNFGYENRIVYHLIEER